MQFEACNGRSVHQWYVKAEGPIGFTDLDTGPLVHAILAKDRGEENADEWTSGNSSLEVQVAILQPRKLSGYGFRESLDSQS